MKFKLRKNLLTRVKASSILEVVVALVLIMLVFGIAMMLYGNVIRSSMSLQQLNATLYLHDLSIRTRENKLFYDEEVKDGENTVSKRVSPYGKAGDLMLVETEIKNPAGQRLAIRKDILLTDGND